MPTVKNTFEFDEFTTFEYKVSKGSTHNENQVVHERKKFGSSDLKL